jgi:threonylcarbamoyladenosine tRNA methylthiotransferase MtaB
MKYAVITFGCRVNQADSLRLEGDLRACGAVESPTAEADLVVVNTCSVTATADQGARQTIRRIVRDNPNVRVIVTGCYATRRPHEIAALPNVVRVVPNDQKDALFSREPMASAPHSHLSVASAFRRKSHDDALDAWLTTALRFGDGEGPCGLAIEPGMAGRTAFTLRVQTGCEEHCSYCIIPTTRGAGRSRPVLDVVREVERIADAGFKEIALTGVHLGSYGRDLEPRGSLIALLQSLGNVDADVTYRISSLEPMDCTPEIVDFVVQSGGRFAPHFHLPLQHAGDRMLGLMRRPYTLEYYGRLVDDIRTKLPHASIGSDMIVGFPGESDEDFATSVAYLSTSPLTHLHVFPYSDRPGTEASALRNKVDPVVVRERGAILRAIGATLARRFRESQIGTLRPGLTLEDGTVVVTDNYLKVRIPPGKRRNERVVVDFAGSYDGLTGRVVESAWGQAD